MKSGFCSCLIFLFFFASTLSHTWSLRLYGVCRNYYKPLPNLTHLRFLLIVVWVSILLLAMYHRLNLTFVLGWKSWLLFISLWFYHLHTSFNFSRSVCFHFCLYYIYFTLFKKIWLKFKMESDKSVKSWFECNKLQMNTDKMKQYWLLLNNYHLHTHILSESVYTGVTSFKFFQSLKKSRSLTFTVILHQHFMDTYQAACLELR